MTIFCKGKRNKVIIEEPIEFSDSIISLTGSNNLIEIKKSKHILFSFEVSSNSDSKLSIGENFSCLSIGISIKNAKEVKIGEDCMCSGNVALLANDTHPIIDKNNGKILNNGGIIEIGNHVWIGRNCIICKNSKISDNSIIGAGAIVTKKFDESNIAIAGVPARIVRRDINWKRE